MLQRVLKGNNRRINLIPQGKSKFSMGNTIGFGGNITGILDQKSPATTGQSEYRNYLSEKTLNTPLPEQKPKEAAKKHTEKLEQIEKDLDTADKRVDDFKKRGYTVSAKMLEHFLKNDGTDFELSREDIQNSKRMQKAIEDNKKRFEDSLIKGYVDNNKNIKSPFKDAILSLKDGETIELVNPNSKTEGDQWDKVIDPIFLPTWMSPLDRDPDQTYSTGTVQISSGGKMTVSREGDTITIKGDINHNVNDIYDFNSENSMEGIAFDPFRRLAENKKASYFNIKGTIPQQIEGRIKIENGKIKESQFYWEDKRQ